MHFSALFAPVASHCIPIRVTFPLHLLTSCERNWHELYVAISLSRAFSGWEIARFLQLARMRAFLCHHKISNAIVGLFNFLRMTMRPGDKMSCYFRSPPENNVLRLLGCQLNICCLVSLKLLFFFCVLDTKSCFVSPFTKHHAAAGFLLNETKAAMPLHWMRII